MPSVNMTHTWLRAVSTDKERDEFYDATFPAFVVRVSRSGTKSYCFRYRDAKGDYQRIALGQFPEISLADAREKARSLRDRLARGEDPIEDRRMARQMVTFAELAGLYLERYAQRNKRSWREDERMLSRDVVPRLGHLKADRVERWEVMQLAQEIADRGAPVMANRTLSGIRRVFNWAIETGILTSHPLARLKRVAHETSRTRVLSHAELRGLWAALGREQSIVSAAFRLLIVTGQRSQEVLRMRWAEIEGDLWVIPLEVAKNRREHVVPLSTPAQEILKEIPRNGSEWVLPSPRKGGSLFQTSLGHAAVRLNRALAFPHWTPHDLRRTVASRMTEIGIEEFHVARVLGHAYTSVTARYNRYSYLAEKRAALEKWGQRLMEIVGAEGSPALR